MSDTEAKHTPGPWQVSSQYGYLGILTPSKGMLCQWDLSYHNQDELLEVNTNAHLISAAPCLLEALEHAADRISMDFCSHGSKCSPGLDNCYASDYLKTIAKAKGEGHE